MANGSVSGQGSTKHEERHALEWMLAVTSGIVATVAGGIILSGIQRSEPRSPTKVEVTDPVRPPDRKVVQDPSSGAENSAGRVAPRVQALESAPNPIGVQSTDLPLQEHPKRRPFVYFSHDFNSRHLASYVEERIAALGVPIEKVESGDAARLATIELRSDVRNDDIDGDSFVRMYVSLGVKTHDGVALSQEKYELVGSSSVDADSALRTASSKFIPVAEHLELVGALRNLVEKTIGSEGTP
jgi:hypothetical protein